MKAFLRSQWVFGMADGRLSGAAATVFRPKSHRFVGRLRRCRVDHHRGRDADASTPLERLNPRHGEIQKLCSLMDGPGERLHR